MKRKPVPISKICTQCRQTLPLDDFYAYHKAGEVYYMPYCIPCNKKRLAAWRHANPEKVRAAARSLYRRVHPDQKRPRRED